MSLPKIPFDPSCDWHVLLAGQRLGPYTRTALQQFLETHPERWEASVWRPGMLDWRPAQRVEALVQESANAAHDVRPRGAAGAETSSVQLLASTSAESAPSDAALPRVWARPPALESARSQAAPPKPSREAAVFMQTPPISRRAPPEFAETTRDMPTFKPVERQPLRTLGLVMVVGGVVALAALVAIGRSNQAPAPESVSVPPTRAEKVAPPSSQAPEAPVQPALQIAAALAKRDTSANAARPSASTEQRAPAQRAPADSERASLHAELTNIRIRARWAPVRAAPNPDAKVLCSVKRGMELRAFGQRPGTRARWFAVHCDKETPGWVHENFLARVRP